MRPWMDRAVARGRIHGRLLLALIVIAAIACLVAVWQFGALRDDERPEYAEIAVDGTTVPAPEAEPDAPTTDASPSPSPASESPSAPAEPEPSTTAAAPAESSAPAETTPAASQCTASLTLDDDGETSIAVTVEVANTGTEPIDGWEVLLDLEHLTVTSTWGLNRIEGDRYGDVFFNGALDPGDGVDPSFRADVEDGFDLPATVPCTPSA
ncbi:cellulose-binding domain-containing protein [Glycomyces sp. A-F 0318]|uniref:cellulose binding domain-containing protein n=1 Tax=Glycomyces amatae TaxID=2881355 RepID=UPI001E3D5565|nr:cellulose binding domain-containing protein [Glycomyces amatae]MCD0444020.1 cellulose-binding domain-containing protein [Glycomyces amatae]